MLVGVAVEAILSILDAKLPSSSVITTAYLVPVLALAIVETGERTAVLAVLASVLALLSGVWNHDLFSSAHLYRLAIVAGGSALGALGAMFRWRAVVGRDRMEMLAAIAEIADGTTDLDDSLRRLADVLVPGAADACSLAVFDFDGTRARRVAVRGATSRLERSLVDLPPPSPHAVQTAQRGDAILVRRFGGMTRRDEISDEALEIMRPTELSSAIYAPVRVGKQTLALLILAVGPSGRRYGADDVRFARTVGSRAALAIQNSRLVDELREARQRLETIVGSLADAVTIRDMSGRLTYANDAAKQSMGLAPAHDISADDPVDLFDRFQVTDEAGLPLDISALPSVKLLAGEEPEPLTLHFVNQETGEARWRVLKSTPLYDKRGRLEAAVTVIEDVTETKLAELRSAFLSRAGEILSSSLDYEQTLRNVAQLAVPEIADWCAVDLLDERGESQQVVAAHRDPAKVALAQRLREFESQPLDPNVGLGAVLSKGVPQLYPQLDDALLQRAAVDGEHLRLLRAVGMRSALAVPMHGGGRIVGAMTLVNAESGRVFTEDDVSFAEQIAARAAVAVENARVYSERARIATTLQRSLLPEALPEIEGWQIASLYRPASSDGAVEVGGDFYDAFAGEHGWLVLIGDVTGKGVEAAAMTSLVRHGARFVSEYVGEPAEILARLDRSLRQQPTLSLCTALCLRIERDRVQLASAGHPLALLVGGDGVRTVGRAGSVLGAFEDGSWPTEEVVIGADEVLVLYTDGVTDTVGANGRFGDERLVETLAAGGALAPDALLRRLDLVLSRFEAGAQADDQAVLALRRTAVPAEALHGALDPPARPDAGG